MNAFWACLVLWVFFSGLAQIPRQVRAVFRLFRRGDE